MLGNTSRPIIFSLHNTSALDKTVTMFMSSVNRGQPNDGFDPAIAVAFEYPPYSYTQLLADSENQGFKIWRIRIDQIAPHIPKNVKYPPAPMPIGAQLLRKLFVSHATADGGLDNYPLQPYQDLDQVLFSAIEYRYPVIINADYGITYSIKPHYEIQVSIWIDKNVSGTNKLLTGDSEKIFVKPFTEEEHVPYVVKLDSPYKNYGQIVYGADKSMNFRQKK